MEVSENQSLLCKICNKQQFKYTCPKCEIPYCSLDCYKSEFHSDCSENFYKACVETELRLKDSDPESRQKMLDILQRMKADMEEDDIENILNEHSEDDEEPLDSDDEDNLNELEERIKDINLDDSNALWAVLTDAEKQEFEALVKSGDADKLIPEWQPWWLFHEDKKLVEEMGKGNEESNYIKKCPQIVKVPKFNEELKPSPCLKFNMKNVLYAYTYTTLYFNGEHMNNPNESVLVFLDLCDNMRCKKNFDDEESASNAVMDRLMTDEIYPVEEQTLLSLKEAVDSIIKGPNELNKAFYIIASLSDLHALFSKAKYNISATNSPKTDFFNKFLKSSKIVKRTQFSKKDLMLCIKKTEYYISWSNSYNINEENINM